MKSSIILILFSILSALFINNCVDEIVVNGPKNQGKLVIASDPAGARIFFMGTNTDKVTPDSILGLESGTYEVTLKKVDCCDTTFNLKVYDKLTTSINAKLIKQKTYGNLFLESIPAGAAIYLSGINTNKVTPDTIANLETGNYEVTLKRKNYLDTTFNINIFKDSTTSFSIQLTQKPPGIGNLFIESVPNGANIYLSGEDTKKITPDSILNLTEGDYQVILSKESYLDTAFNVNIKDSATTSKIITLKSTKTTGSVFLQSVPNGAQIYISGTNTNKTTPEGIINLKEGDYEFTLKLPGYNDTTFNVDIIKDKRVDKTIILKKDSESGSVSLESSPTGAQIFLEGINTNKLTPSIIENLDEGSHQFTLKLSGYNDTTFNINIIKNQQVNKNITLTRHLNIGSLILQSTPSGAQIFLEGVNTNKFTPSTIENLEEGLHQVTLKLIGYRDTTFDVTIIKDQQVNKNVTLTQQINTGSVLLQSTPSGAQIFLDGTNISKLTPSTIQNIGEGLHQFTLKLSGYNDTTFNITIIKNQQVNETIILTKEITTGSVFLQSSPSGAQIFLDGSNTSKLTPSTIQDVEEGLHQFTLKLNGYYDTTFNVAIIKGQQVSKTITLTEEITTGSLLLQSLPSGAQIFLDGSNTSKLTPSTIQDLEEGSHRFTLKLNGYYDTTFNVTIIRGEQVSKTITLTEEITTGSILLQSLPSGAQIFLEGTNTNKVTPSTIQDLEEGSHRFTLKLNGYYDTTFNVTIIRGEQVSKTITLTEEITTGSILLQSLPSGAQIFLEGTNTNKATPSTIQDLEEGSHRFTLKLNGYNDTTFNVTIIREQQISKNITLTKEITTGSLYISSEPSSAEIFLNNNNTGNTTPSTIYDLQEGSYSLTLKLNYYKDTTVNVQIVRQQLTSKNIILTESNPVIVDHISTRIYINQIRFSFSFNQDVLLGKVEVFEPNNSGSQTFNFSNQNIKKRDNTYIYYPKVLKGTWKLIFYGTKAKDSQTDFIIETELEVN